MHILFYSKTKLRQGLLYAAAVCLLAGCCGLLLPEDRQAAAAEPYRSGDENSNCISLTFNVDWGEEYLPDILEVLAKYQVPATFFLTGRWCSEHPELAANINQAGHEIGNHSYSHASPNASTAAQIEDEIARTETAIQEATGITTRLYAPPSGENEPHVLQAATDAGYTTVLWSVDTIDWQQPDAATVQERVLSKAAGGSIILAHPTEPTLTALPAIISELQAKGYRFVTVSQNLGL